MSLINEFSKIFVFEFFPSLLEPEHYRKYEKTCCPINKRVCNEDKIIIFEISNGYPMGSQNI